MKHGAEGEWTVREICWEYAARDFISEILMPCLPSPPYRNKTLLLFYPLRFGAVAGAAVTACIYTTSERVRHLLSREVECTWDISGHQVQKVLSPSRKHSFRWYIPSPTAHFCVVGVE